MFKIMFSNIYDDEFYAGRKGGDIRKDIMSCINALTLRGLNRIKKQFYKDGGTEVDRDKVRKWV